MFQLYFKRIYAKLLTVFFDIAAIPLAWYIAYWLRFNMQWNPPRFMTLYSLKGLMVVMLIQVGSYYGFKVYRGLWQFSSLSDMNRIIRSVITTVIIAYPLLYVLDYIPYIPRSILALYAILLIPILCWARLYSRFYFDKKNQTIQSATLKRVLIVGAGQAGESLIRDLKRNQEYLPIGLVDDNKSKRGLEVHGVSVLGTIDEIPYWVLRKQIDLIFIAIPSVSSVEMRRIVTQCELSKVPFHTLPTLQALTSGYVEVNSLRKVNLDDLLGRDQVTLNWEKIAQTIADKKVLITGGGGSIGSELCRQILPLNPSDLVILDNSEFNLYNIDQEIRAQFPNVRIHLALINVFDAVAVDNLFNTIKPDIVFHAAAYKHVPLLEDQIRPAIQNNVLGTKVMAEISVSHGVKKFILISSDKAVNPTNIMGASKRVAEIFCQNLNTRVATEFITVRFGNVLGSVGSVVPLFQKQLAQGGPLTVTHPDMERYFMSLSEACQLILQAMVSGHGGEILVLDMGEPIKISYLAEQMIRLSGKIPQRDIQIKYTGLRPGEKLFEELFHTSESLTQTEHEKLFQATVRSIDWNNLIETMQQIKHACDTYDNRELLFLLKYLVPEFKTDLVNV